MIFDIKMFKAIYPWKCFCVIAFIIARGFFSLHASLVTRLMARKSAKSFSIWRNIICLRHRGVIIKFSITSDRSKPPFDTRGKNCNDISEESFAENEAAAVRGDRRTIFISASSIPPSSLSPKINRYVAARRVVHRVQRNCWTIKRYIL